MNEQTVELIVKYALNTNATNAVKKNSDILGKDLGMDSLDVVNAVIEMEEKLNIEILDEELQPFQKGKKTVQDVIDFVKTKSPVVTY